MTVKKLNTGSLTAQQEATLADRLGELNDLIKEAEAERDDLKDQFKTMGKQAIQGKNYAVNLLKSFRSTLNRKKLEEAIGADTVAKYMEENEYIQVRVSPL
jgi:hypothetical protein